MASSITGFTSNSAQAPNTTQATSSSSADSPSNLQSMFLKLFVAQLQNQDPLNPPQGTEFVSQLAQLTEVEQVTQINSNVGAIDNFLTSPAKASGNTGSTPASGPSN